MLRVGYCSVLSIVVWCLLFGDVAVWCVLVLVFVVARCLMCLVRCRLLVFVVGVRCGSLVVCCVVCVVVCRVLFVVAWCYCWLFAVCCCVLLFCCCSVVVAVRGLSCVGCCLLFDVCCSVLDLLLFVGRRCLLFVAVGV